MTIKVLRLPRHGGQTDKRRRSERDPRPIKPQRPVRYHSLSLPSLYTREVR